ncbi:hypothetical protein [Actinomadura parmotrematis]|uniref:Uncharacterized protein n=1 Tax=Actinomadura parmotrematis TaxID=2864039 RepID=A0ABS7FXQ5_9ACTN|nr:hypothetical protein [Actinomadura parmotrematis]MBW8485210.1 hypothetical protein [Actinomadura parmotrematis]
MSPVLPFLAAALLGVPAPPTAACGVHVCLEITRAGSFVRDATAYTRDGRPGTLRVSWGDWHSSLVHASRFTWNVNDARPFHDICAALDRGGRKVEDHICVRVIP